MTANTHGVMLAETGATGAPLQARQEGRLMRARGFVLAAVTALSSVYAEWTHSTVLHYGRESKAMQDAIFENAKLRCLVIPPDEAIVPDTSGAQWVQKRPIVDRPPFRGVLGQAFGGGAPELPEKEVARRRAIIKPTAVPKDLQVLSIWDVIVIGDDVYADASNDYAVRIPGCSTVSAGDQLTCFVKEAGTYEYQSMGGLRRIVLYESTTRPLDRESWEKTLKAGKTFEVTVPIEEKCPKCHGAKRGCQDCHGTGKTSSLGTTLVKW